MSILVYRDDNGRMVEKNNPTQADMADWLELSARRNAAEFRRNFVAEFAKRSRLLAYLTGRA